MELVVTSHIRAKKLVERFSDETRSESPWYDDQDLFLAWLSNISRASASSTFKSYRKWLAAYAAYLGFDQFAYDIKQLSDSAEKPSLDRAEDKDSQHTPIEQKTTAAAQSELLTGKAISSLVKVLTSKRSDGDTDRYKNGLLSITWLQMTMMTGVRPSEWSSAVLLEDVETENGEHFNYVLEVVGAAKGGLQAKKSGLNESERRRRLVLDTWSEGQIEMLKLFLMDLPGDAIAFSRLQESVRQTLLLASKAAVPDMTVSLYMGRHIFASEVRREDAYSRYQLAAMLGHSDTVNQKYYGERSVNETGRQFKYALPLPWPGSSEKVEMVDRKRYELIYGSSRTLDMLEKVGLVDLDSM